MTKANINPAPRFTEGEIEAVFSRLTNILASIEAEWEAVRDCHQADIKGRHLDTIRTLAQVGGFIAGDAGSDCGYFGDVFEWLEIPQGVQS